MDVTCFSRIELGRLIDQLNVDRQELRTAVTQLRAENQDLRQR